MKLSKDHLGMIFEDHYRNDVIIQEYVTSCCRMPYFLGSIIGTSSLYPYDSNGNRLDHNLKYHTDTNYNLNLE